ncbi:methyltransferase family protein [Candidatus Latescibacterota bacterium]
MVAIGNFFFRYRNALFPLFYVALFVPSAKMFDSYYTAAIISLPVCLSGQGIRILTIGMVYIIRGGSKRRIFAKDLVTTGMFFHCRNPLYVGNIMILLGLGIIADSLLFVIFIMPIFVFAYQAIVLAEEHFLQNKFGDKYGEYMLQANRWFPNLTGLGETLGSMRFRWKRVIIREYNSTFIWITGALSVFMRNVYSDDKDLFYSLLPYTIVVFAVLSICYSTIRFLKKSKKLRDE